MNESNNKEIGTYLKSIWLVFSFYKYQGRKIRRTKLFFIVGILPVIMAIIIKFTNIISHNINVRGLLIFSNMIMVFYLQFFILILALFYGTSICSEEVEGKTLTYLTTRPISKSSVILGKYMAYTFIIMVIVVTGVVFSFVILNAENLLDWSIYKILFRDLGVLTLGLICYTALFAFLGTFLKKSVLFGVIYCFGWESVIQYFPGSTQKFTIVHYLKSLLPEHAPEHFSFLIFRLDRSSVATSITMLFVMTAVFLLLASLFFVNKEYILED